MIHHGLEGGWGIGEAKEHHRQFEKSSIGFKSGLPLVTVVDLNVVVAPLDIELHKEC